MTQAALCGGQFVLICAAGGCAQSDGVSGCAACCELMCYVLAWCEVLGTSALLSKERSETQLALNVTCSAL